jgi:hypothetical protein
MSTVYVLCDVFPGLFDSEYYVLVNGSSAYHVHRDNVQVKSAPKAEEAVKGLVRAYLIDKEGGKTLVQLPGEPAVGGLRTWVEDEALQPA